MQNGELHLFGLPIDDMVRVAVPQHRDEFVVFIFNYFVYKFSLEVFFLGDIKLKIRQRLLRLVIWIHLDLHNEETIVAGECQFILATCLKQLVNMRHMA